MLMDYYVEFWFYSPDRKHHAQLTNIYAAAKRLGIAVELLSQHPFRNPQRFGAKTTKTFLRFEADDQRLLQLFVEDVRNYLQPTG